MTDETGTPVAHEAEGTDDVIDVDPDEEVIPLHYTITSYGADFLVDGLVSRLSAGDIVVPSFDPEYNSESGVVGFQRGYVWSRPQADRFLESLLLGMPVPGIFLVREQNGKHLVLDGQQRLRTLQNFFKGVIGSQVYKLKYVQEPWTGATYESLDDEDRRRLNDSIIHATILRQDSPDDYSAIYSIFERINTGGTPLQPQEIRVALFTGEFVNLLRRLNTNASWRNLYGPRSPRLKDQELILRFFAMLETSDRYSRPLKGFLNTYIAKNENLTADRSDELASIFESTVDAIFHAIGPNAFRPVRSMNAAVFDSIMVGVARRLEAGGVESYEELGSAYSDLIDDPPYKAATESSTAAEESVETRIRLATAAFEDV